MRRILIAASNQRRVVKIINLASGYVSTVLADSPTYYYRMEEASGNIIDEIVANSLPPVSEASIDYQQSGAHDFGMFFNGGRFEGTQDAYSGARTIELSIKLLTTNAPGNDYLVSRNNTYDIIFNFGGTNTINLFRNVGPLIGTGDIVAPIPRDDMWHHFIVTYDGAVILAYVDGVEVDSFAISAIADSQTGITIGDATGGGAAFSDGLDEISFYDYALSSAQVTAHYNAWLPALPQPDFSSVTLLLGFEGTDGSTTIIDESNSAHNATAVNQAAIDTDQFKFGLSSCIFDGNDDHIRIDDDPDWDFGGDDFTIEAWVRYNATPLSRGEHAPVISAFESSPVAWWFWARSNETLTLTLITDTGSIITTGTFEPMADTWYHLAACRSGDTCRLFVDGSEVASESVGTSIVDSTGQNIRVGSGRSGDGQIDGWMDEVRIIKGEGIYTSSFTPPTAPHPRS